MNKLTSVMYCFATNFDYFLSLKSQASQLHTYGSFFKFKFYSHKRTFQIRKAYLDQLESNPLLLGHELTVLTTAPTMGQHIMSSTAKAATPK